MNVPPTFPTGISKTPTGWRVSIGPRGPKRHTKRFPASVPLDTVRQYWQEKHDRLSAGNVEPPGGKLGADVARHCARFRGGAGPANEERRRHLALWIVELGGATMETSKVTPSMVADVIALWHQDGHGLGTDTCNKRRTALGAFYSALNGKAGYNPVRETERQRPPDALPREIQDYTKILKVFADMPKCKSRARLKVMAYTGARPAEVRRITLDSWNRQNNELILAGTKKGKGTRPRTIPLGDLPEARAALQELEETDAIGTFTGAPLARMWKSYAVLAGLPTSHTPYSLRHTFGTRLWRATRDLALVQRLMGHANIDMTKRYTLGAAGELEQAAMKAFGAGLSASGAPVVHGGAPNVHQRPRKAGVTK